MLSTALAQSAPIPAYRNLTSRTLLRAPCPAGEVERLAWFAAGPDGEPSEAYAFGTWRWRQQDVMIAEYPANSGGTTRLWIDWNGDGVAEEVYESVDAMGKVYPHTCMIFEKARRLANADKAPDEFPIGLDSRYRLSTYSPSGV
jgi:hypothetical protein